MTLPPEFYAPADPVALARALLGKRLITEIGGRRTVGRITETEAYWAPEDRASHAYGYRRTARTETMYAAPGTAYVYLCYGIHHLFNVVTGPKDTPHAVLIRAVEPIEGVEHMLERRGLARVRPQLTAGPGVMSVALGITTAYDGYLVTQSESPIRIEDGATPAAIGISPRVGVESAGESAGLPWRFFELDNPFVSKRR